jgi:endonuclease-8
VPEGDTLHNIAARLRPALVGAELRRFDAPRLVGPRPRAGKPIGAVDAVGKHLMVAFGDGVVLQTHLRMTGSWHLYAAGERWRKPAHLMRARIGVEGWDAVCFSAPVVRTHLGEVAAARSVAHLGPDLCRPDADIDSAVERMAAVCDEATTIADALLDQRIAAGIGNVYKSEVLWAHRIDPFVPVTAIEVGMRAELLATASRLLQANLGTTRRQTVPGGLGVYGRTRRPCRRCGSPIRSRRHGAQARSTYWCPRCQPAGATGTMTA